MSSARSMNTEGPLKEAFVQIIIGRLGGLVSQPEVAIIREYVDRALEETVSSMAKKVVQDFVDTPLSQCDPKLRWYTRQHLIRLINRKATRHA